MFIQRVLTAIILAPCLIALMLWGPEHLLYGLLFVVMLVAANEWRHLIPLKTSMESVAFICLYTLLILVVSYVRPPWIIFLIVLWLPICCLILAYPGLTRLWRPSWVVWLVVLSVSCLFVFALQGVFMHPDGRGLVIYLFLLVWAADVGAYLFGKLWGKHKLIPSVSPGKSWEGFLGGMVFVSGVSVAGAMVFQPENPINWYFMNFVCFIVSIFGDLFISMLKRKCKLKDTGQLLPGHGGILDRIDSLIAAAPFFYAGMYLTHFGQL